MSSVYPLQSPLILHPRWQFKRETAKIKSVLVWERQHLFWGSPVRGWGLGKMCGHRLVNGGTDSGVPAGILYLNLYCLETNSIVQIGCCYLTNYWELDLSGIYLISKINNFLESWPYVTLQLTKSAWSIYVPKDGKRSVQIWW